MRRIGRSPVKANAIALQPIRTLRTHFERPVHLTEHRMLQPVNGTGGNQEMPPARRIPRLESREPRGQFLDQARGFGPATTTASQFWCAW
jgi:hypothetical protein